VSAEWRVLVVDDEEVVLAGIEKLLDKDRMKIDMVRSVSAALERLMAGSYDLVITDLVLPDADGLHLIGRIRDRGVDIPVILITGYSTIHNAMAALRSGAVEYLPKPFTRSELRGAIHRALRRRLLGRPGKPAGRSRDGRSGEPGSVFRLPEHTWLRINEDGSIRVGMDPVFARIAGELMTIDMPSESEFVEQGRACFMAVDIEGVSHFLCAPASGRVLRVNVEAASRPGIVHDDPEGEGWLIEMQPMDIGREIKNLVSD